MFLRFLVLSILSVAASAQEITVAAAADLGSAMPEIAARYKAQTGREVKLTFGASGNLTTQIRNVAPCDIFFSADEDYPKQLIEAGLAERDTLYRYAVGRLVLWVPNDSPLDLQKLGIRALLNPSVTKIS